MHCSLLVFRLIDSLSVPTAVFLISKVEVVNALQVGLFSLVLASRDVSTSPGNSYKGSRWTFHPPPVLVGCVLNFIMAGRNASALRVLNLGGLTLEWPLVTQNPKPRSLNPV